MSNPCPAILVLDCHRHTLPVVRSLGRAGYRVVAGTRVGRRNDRFVSLSRFVNETWTHPDYAADKGDAFLKALQARLSDGDIVAVFPVGEASLRLLGQAVSKGRLPVGVRPLMASPLVVERCLDKAASFVWASEIGLPLPRSVLVRDAGGLAAAAEEAGYPCAVKPESSEERILGKKCLLVDTPAELARALPEWPEGQGALLVQSRAQGFRHNCIFLASGGRVVRYFEGRVLRTDASDGTGYGVEVLSVVPSARRREHCERAVAHLGYEGVGCLQFLVDPAHDSEVFLELNPRLDATIALPVALGMDFPRWTVEGGLGKPLGGGPLGGDYPVGRRYAWTLGDFTGARAEGAAALAARLPKLVLTLLRARVHATFEWTDPAPALYLWALQAASIGARVTGLKSLRKRLRPGR